MLFTNCIYSSRHFLHTHTYRDTCAYALWAWRVTVVAFEIYVDSFSMRRVSGETCYAYAVLHTNEAPQTQHCSRVANSCKYIYIYIYRYINYIYIYMMHFCLALLANAAFSSMLWLEATAKRKLQIALDWQILCMFAGNCK